MFWRGPYYTTRCTGLYSIALQASGDIVHLAIVLPVVPSFKSVLVQQGVLLDTVRSMCAAQPGFSAPRSIYVLKTLP